MADPGGAPPPSGEEGMGSEEEAEAEEEEEEEEEEDEEDSSMEDEKEEGEEGEEDEESVEVSAADSKAIMKLEAALAAKPGLLDTHLQASQGGEKGVEKVKALAVLDTHLQARGGGGEGGGGRREGTVGAVGRDAIKLCFIPPPSLPRPPFSTFRCCVAAACGLGCRTRARPPPLASPSPLISGGSGRRTACPRLLPATTCRAWRRSLSAAWPTG